MNYYSFHIGDYAAHTRRLDLLEDLAYRRILDEYYLSEKPLLGEPDLIAKLIGMPEYVEAVEYVLTSFFECTPDGYYNKRCEAEISEMQHRSKVAKEKADKRWSEAKIRDKPSYSNAVALPQQSQCNATNTNTNTNTKDKDISKPDGIDSVIWKDYLKLRNKQKKPLTETALKGLAREADKANLPLADVLQICCERGWVGFKADWLDSKQTTKTGGQEWRTNDGAMLAKAGELGLHTVGLQRFEIVNKIADTLRSRGL